MVNASEASAAEAGPCGVLRLEGALLGLEARSLKLWSLVPLGGQNLLQSSSSSSPKSSLPILCYVHGASENHDCNDDDDDDDEEEEEDDADKELEEDNDDYGDLLTADTPLHSESCKLHLLLLGHFSGLRARTKPTPVLRSCREQVHQTWSAWHFASQPLGSSASFILLCSTIMCLGTGT